MEEHKVGRGVSSNIFYYAVGDNWFRIDTKKEEMHILIDDEWYNVDDILD